MTTHEQCTVPVYEVHVHVMYKHMHHDCSHSLGSVFVGVTNLNQSNLGLMFGPFTLDLFCDQRICAIRCEIVIVIDLKRKEAELRPLNKWFSLRSKVSGFPQQS